MSKVQQQSSHYIQTEVLWFFAFANHVNAGNKQAEYHIQSIFFDQVHQTHKQLLDQNIFSLFH
ncbi:hypothetical protein [Fructilactobacillus lindneri]|uniref:hypothetical protein n=1 Tax=Fructilactobacillus lindneri TaxID=53444 RepID=UPI00384F9D88